MDLVPSRLVEKSELRNQGKLPSLGSMVRLCLAGWNALMARCFLAGLNWCSKNGVPLKSSGWSSISWLKLTFWDIKHPGMAHCWSEKAIMLHFRTRVGVGQVPKKIEAPTTIGPLKVLRGYPRPRRDGLMEGLSFAGRGPKGWVPDVLGIVQTILPTWDIAMICLTERERERERGREGERERGREGERERGREGERERGRDEFFADGWVMLRSFAASHQLSQFWRSKNPSGFTETPTWGNYFTIFHRSDYTVLCLTAQKCMGFSFLHRFIYFKLPENTPFFR